jgi:amidase
MNVLAKPVEAGDIDVTELTIADVQEGFAAGRFTSEALTLAHLKRIEKYEPYYNAFTYMHDGALADARAIDARRAAGEMLGPLAGVPVVIKEAMAGRRCRAALAGST